MINFTQHCLILACSTALAGAPAFAQSAPTGGQPAAGPQPMAAAPGSSATASTDKPPAQTPSNSTSAGAVGEIVVTAQRVETKLSRTPVAVAVIGADTLAKANIQSEQDLQQATPGLTVRAGASSNQLNFALRGQSLDAYSFGRPGVQPYFDEIQIRNPNGTSSIYYDLQSVQVLKGPQGTLFGRNSTGGAVLYTTTKPSYDLEGYASLLGGNYGTFKGEGAINVPIVKDEVALRVAGFYSTTNGFQYDTFDGKRRGDSERYGVRGSLRTDFGSFHNNLVVDYQYASGTSLAGNIGNIDPTQGAAFPTAALYNPATSDAVLALVLQGLGVPSAAAGAIATGNYANYVATHPQVNPAGIGAEFAAQQARGPFVVDSDGSDAFTTKNLQISNVTAFDLNDSTQLRNVLGYVNIKGYQALDVDGSNYAIVEAAPNGGTHNLATSFSEELQLVGKTGNFRYVAGGYYNAEKAANNNNSVEFDIIPYGLLIGQPGVRGITQVNVFTLKNTTYAGYAQGTYDLSDSVLRGLSLTAGARYTSEKVRGITEPGDAGYALATTGLVGADGVILPASAFSNDQSHTYHNVSWTLSVNEQLSPDLLIYAASRRSFKNGGFNGIVQPRIGYSDAAVIPGNAYKAEKLTDAELGMKFNGRLGDVPTALDIAGYYDWITNSQRTAFTSVNGEPATVTVNVPAARVYGFEIDGSMHPAEWLRVGGTLNYTHARFTDNLVTIGTLTQAFGTYPDTPKWSAGPYVDLIYPASTDISVVLHSEVFAETKSYFSSTANINTGAVIHGYAVANFRLGLQDDKSGWTITANLKNAFNRVYYVGGLALAQLTQVNTLIPGAPRTFTIEARIKF